MIVDENFFFFYNSTGKMIRPFYFASNFYPADKVILKDQISDFLDAAEKKNYGRIRILTVPHAGIAYSGKTAAWGFKQLEGSQIKKVIMLGVSHQNKLSAAACYDRGAWQTPLGTVPVDQDLGKKLVEKNSVIGSNLKYHFYEHSLEVELPFLQTVLPKAKIVPLLLNVSLAGKLPEIAVALADNLKQDTLLLISSDLSHYPEYKVAQKVDKRTIKAIESGRIENLNEAIKKNLSEPGVESVCCGHLAIKTGLLVAQRLGFETIKLLHYSNSGDAAGVKNQVVGYASIGMYA